MGYPPGRSRRFRPCPFRGLTTLQGLPGLIPQRSPALLLLAIVAAPALQGQSASVTRADLRVSVLAQGTKHGLTGALVKVASEATGQRFHGSTREGEVVFHHLPAGSYAVEVRAPGRALARAGPLRLHMGEVTLLRMSLALEAGAEVEVGTPEPQTGLSPEGAVFDQADIATLPINRRDFLDFTLLAPGVVRANAPENGGAAANSGLSFLGGNPRQNNVMVDGLDNNDLSVGSVRRTFSQEVVQEFRVVTAGFSAEYGRFTGGVVNLVTRGGTNVPQGTLFWSLRPGGDFAASPAEGPGTAFRQTQAGLAFGLPLVKDRLFVFVGVERFQKDEDKIVSIPRAYTPPGGGAPVDVLEAFRVAGFAVEDGALPSAETASFAFLRLDWLAGPHQVILRANHAREDNQDQLPWGGLTARSGGGARRIEDTTLAVSHLFQASPSFLNEARVMWNRRNHSLQSLDPEGRPMVIVLGTATFGSNRFLPQYRLEQNLQLVETLTWTGETHTLKAGLDGLQTRVHGEIPLHFAGLYRFQGLGAGLPDGMSAFLVPNPFGGTGLPAVFTQGFGDPRVRARFGSYAAFLQDDWRPVQNFCLRIGLRYDRSDSPDFEDAAAYRQLRTPDGTSAGPNLGPVRIARDRQSHDFDGLLTPTLDWDDAQVSPRVSFTWNPAGRWEIDGGWGRFTGRVVSASWATAATFNGSRAVYVVRTALDPPAAGPFAAWAQPGHRFTVRPAGTPALLMPGDMGLPETRHARLGLQGTLRPGLKLSLHLDHVRGKGFAYLRDVNAPVPNPYANTDPAAQPNPAVRRPDLRFSSVFRFSGDGESRTFSQTLGCECQGATWRLQAQYTHSRAEDDYTDITTDLQPQDSFEPHAEWGPSWHDQRHRLTVHGAFRTRASERWWLRDWTLAWTAVVASGRPLSRLAGRDLNANGDGESDRVGLGPRNTESSPSTANLDLRLSRAFGLGRMRLEVTVEVFNALNRTNVERVQAYANAPTPFGSPTAYGPRRQTQFGARLSF